MTYRNNTKTAWGKVWKLLLRLISVPSTRATLPNIYREKEKERGRMRVGEKNITRNIRRTEGNQIS